MNKTELKNLLSKEIMKDVWITVKEDRNLTPVTDSIRIAEIFKKEHFDLLRSVRRMISELEEVDEVREHLQEHVTASEYISSINQKQPRYELTHIGFLLFLPYINTKKSRQLSARITIAFSRVSEKLASLDEEAYRELIRIYHED
jgi:Rha family phage regulatory protein